MKFKTMSGMPFGAMIDAADNGDCVWMSFHAGVLTSMFMLSLDDAEQIANMLLSAKADAMRNAEKYAEARLGMA